MCDMTLRNPRGYARQEQEPSSLHAPDLIHAPVGVRVSAPLYESGGRLSRVWLDNGRVLLAGWCAHCRHYIIVVLCLPRCRSWDGCSSGPRLVRVRKGYEAFQMAPEWAPSLVGNAVQQPRVDDEDGNGQRDDSNPARPARIRRCKPPYKQDEAQ